MYRRLKLRTTNHRTYLLKVGQSDPLKVIILHTGWKPTRGFISCRRSTLSLVELCLRRDEAHAIVQFLFSSPHFWSRHPFSITSYGISSQKTATFCISFYFLRLPFIHSIQVMPFWDFTHIFPISHTLTSYIFPTTIPVVTRSTGIMAWSAVYAWMSKIFTFANKLYPLLPCMSLNPIHTFLSSAIFPFLILPFEISDLP